MKKALTLILTIVLSLFIVQGVMAQESDSMTVNISISSVAEFAITEASVNIPIVNVLGEGNSTPATFHITWDASSALGATYIYASNDADGDMNISDYLTTGDGLKVKLISIDSGSMIPVGSVGTTWNLGGYDGPDAVASGSQLCPLNTPATGGSSTWQVDVNGTQLIQSAPGISTMSCLLHMVANEL